MVTGEGEGEGGKYPSASVPVYIYICWCVVSSADGEGGPWPAGLPKPSPVLTVKNTGNLHHPILPAISHQHTRPHSTTV